MTSSAARVRAMLSARSVAVVGASDRVGSFGRRLTTEALRSPGIERVHLVHPTRTSVFDKPVVPSLADVPGPVDLVLCGVPDKAVASTLAIASERGDGGAVTFGLLAGFKEDVIAAAGDMALVGGGCMGFVNTVTGVRAIGYMERDPLPAGPIALVTHSGSVFSAILRTRRALGWTLAVSSGQELVTTTPDYLEYALSLPETKVVGLVMETMRDPKRLEACLADAAARDIPVCAVTVGTSEGGQALVDAHSGAIAGSDAGWEALFSAYGVHRCGDLDDLTDSLEMFAIGRRHVPGTGRGIATAHDSGAERVLVADIAEVLDVPFAPLAESTVARLSPYLDAGLIPMNPLDVWGRGSDTVELFTESLAAMAEDPATGAVVLAVDLSDEYDGDESYPIVMENLQSRTDKPLAVLSNLTSAVSPVFAERLRSQGIPVLEGTASGLRALGHLMAERPRPRPSVVVDTERQGRWAVRLSTGATLSTAEWTSLLTDYGMTVTPSASVTTSHAAVAAAERLGFPVVVKSDAPQVHHKTEADGVRLGLADSEAVASAYADLAERLGPQVVVQHQASGVEVALGVVDDQLLGPLVMVAAGGVLVELVADRAVALPPVDRETALEMIGGLKVATLLAGFRGATPSDTSALADTVVALGQLVVELGDHLAGVDLNPVIVGPDSALVVDALVLPG
jgi:acetate---CoA ligase (ADP-forming)